MERVSDNGRREEEDGEIRENYAEGNEFESALGKSVRSLQGTYDPQGIRNEEGKGNTQIGKTRRQRGPHTLREKWTIE